jgi:hypothetical protein
MHAKKVRSATWINVLLFSLIGFGGLLSISALIAIPVLSDSKPMSETEMNAQAASLEAIVKIDELRGSLELPKDEGMEGRYTDLEKQLESLITKLTTQQAKPTSDGTPAADPARTGADASVLTLNGDRVPAAVAIPSETALSVLNSAKDALEQAKRSVPEEYKRYSQDLLIAADTSKQYALAALQRQNLAPGGVRSSNIADVHSWLADTMSQLRRTATACRAAVHDRLEQTASTASEQLEWIKQGIYTGFGPATAQSISGAMDRCLVYTGGQNAPTLSSLSLGAFGFSAWLINLNSMPLTLIAGMLGFGLVGAAISSVVRERGKRQEGEPLVSDLPGIMVRGLSATIVVYLAVKSGLLIFTGGSSSQADPHVLLLTCLIASVFSEDVWDAARTRFVKGLRGNDQAADREVPEGEARG